MACLVPENWACIKADDDDDVFKGIDISKINSTALLISFLEDSIGEEHDDEQLLSMIRSLEAEIHPNSRNRYDPLVEAQLGIPTEDFQLHRHGQVKGHDCLAALDMEFDWIDMEISSYQPGDHMTGRCMEHCGDEMDGVIEFEGVRDYNSQVAWHVSLEEHGYNCLWLETHDSMV